MIEEAEMVRSSLRLGYRKDEKRRCVSEKTPKRQLACAKNDRETVSRRIPILRRTLPVAALRRASEATRPPHSTRTTGWGDSWATLVGYEAANALRARRRATSTMCWLTSRERPDALLRGLLASVFRFGQRVSSLLLLLLGYLTNRDPVLGERLSGGRPPGVYVHFLVGVG
jgi:hypothetical protein